MNENFSDLINKYKETEFADLFKELIKLLNIKTYVELGVRTGYTFNQIAPLVKRAVAVDMNSMKTIVVRPNVEKYQHKTDDFSKIWKDEIDFLFIDADHRKAQVLKDFDNFSIFVKEGTGLIALHDTHPICEELLDDAHCSNSWEAAWEIRTNPKYNKFFEIITLPGPFAGLSLIRKSKKQLSWNIPVKEKNKISVIIPFLNQVKSTHNLLLNIKENSYLPFEVILIDNGSSEDTTILTKFKGLNIKYVKNEKNIGVNPAWNLGMELVDKSCNLISILNNDIVITNTFFEKVDQTFNSDKFIGIAVPINVKLTEKLESKSFTIENLPKREGYAFTIRKEIADKIRPIPEQLVIFYGDDYLFYSVTKLGYRQVRMVGNNIHHRISTTVRDIYPNRDDELKLSHRERDLWEQIKEKIDGVVVERPQMVYDCFPFFNELDLLEIRLNELNSCVDKFVLVECTKTHRGKDKPLYFKENQYRFKDYLDKIIHIVVEDAPELDSTGWNIENFQRNCIMKGLTNCRPDDIIIVSDIDEIPRNVIFRKRYKFLNQIDANFYIIQQKLSYYYLNTPVDFVWNGTYILKYKMLQSKDPQYFRIVAHSGKSGICIFNGGWHFSYLSSIEDIKYKVSSFAHSEVDKPEINNIKNLTKSVSELKIFFDNKRYTMRLENFSNCDLPQYVKINEEKFKQFIRR